MRHILSTALCLALASPAWSLSCLRPDVVRIYEMAREAEAGFWIVRGQIFADDPIAVPEPRPDGSHEEGASASTPVAFVGLGLMTDGTYREFSQTITLTITCLSHWCGSAPLETDVFAAIEVKDTGPELVIDPCSSRIATFSDEDEERLLRCVRDGTCGG